MQTTTPTRVATPMQGTNTTQEKQAKKQATKYFKT
jgi:hypothetical protein